VGYLLVYDTTCSLGRTVPLSRSNRCTDGCATQPLLYPLREDSELSSGACSPPRYNPHWLPIHTTNTRTIHVRHGLTSCRRHTVNTSSRCPIRSLSVLRLHVLRPCIRGTGRCDRTPTCGFLVAGLPQSESRTSSGRLTASVPTPRSTHSVMMVSERTWKKCVSRSASFLRAHVDLLDGPFYLPCRTLNA